MLNAVSLIVGEFFAEASTKKSWFFNKKSLTDGVRECLQDHFELKPDSEETTVVRFYVSQSSLKRSHSDFDHIGFFVTAGFESLLELIRPQLSHAFSRTTNFESQLNIADNTFGVSERCDSSAKILRSVEVADLEFFLAKLQLLSINTIAVGFLHSNLNPENELLVSQFFKLKGFQVFCAHEENAALTETERWQNALLRARLAYRQQAITNQLSSLKTQYPKLQIENLNPAESTKTKFSDKIFSTFKISEFKVEKNEALLYLGIEGFHLLDSSKLSELKIGATSIITSGFFNTPEFGEASLSFDPGPMIMGKSFVPTLFDFIFATGTLTQLENFGISQLSAEKAKPRILEAVLALVRNNQERKHIDIQKEFLNLEKILSYRIWSEILKLSNFKKLKISGPLAHSIFPIIKTYRPQGIELILAAEELNEWAHAK